MKPVTTALSPLDGNTSPYQYLPGGNGLYTPRTSAAISLARRAMRACDSSSKVWCTGYVAYAAISPGGFCSVCACVAAE